MPKRKQETSGKNETTADTETRRIQSFRKRVLRSAIIIAVFGIAVYRLFTGFDDVPFHGDEAGWTTAGYYYYQLMFIDHDLSPAKWSKRELWEFGLLSLPAGKYIIGFAMHLALPRGNYFYSYDFAKTENENRERGNIPPPDVLRPARIMSALATVITYVGLFVICMHVWNWMVGAATVALLAFNPLFSLFAQRAMTDSYLILFLVLAALCCVVLSRMDLRKPAIFLVLSGFLGIVCGLCGSVKLNGLLKLVCAAFTLACIIITKKSRRVKDFGLVSSAGIVIVVLAGAMMIALNPLFYTSSPSGLYDRFQYLVGKWAELLTFQQHSFPAQAIAGFPTVALMRLAQEYLSPLLTIALLLGATRTVYQFVRARRSQAKTSLIVFTGTAAIISVAVLAWIPLDWDRYYLPVVTMVMPFAAYGIVTVGEFAVERIRMRREPDNSGSQKFKKTGD